MSKLEIATYICLISGCAVSVGLQLERRFAPATGRWETAGGSELIGKTLDVPGVKWQAHRVNTVLFMSTHCHFCLESMPYYRRLAVAKDASGAHVPFAVISLDPAEDINAILSAEHIETDGVYRLTKRDPRLLGTPKLLVTDSKGVVRKAYIGKLGPAQEVEFLGILASGSI